ncbi:MAG: MBL fold metallo-hydrolase [Pseudomonadota bacterium]
MKVRLLGAGTSSGVPRIGNDWGACDPAEPRNRRTRASLLVDSGATRLLIDTSPDLREQLLAAGVASVDAVIWTHDHADHTHGIDDLRQLFHTRGSAIPGYARGVTRTAIEHKFGYVVRGNDGYPPTVDLHNLNDLQRFPDLIVKVMDQPHGSISSAGLRFEAAGKAIGYATDFHTMTDAMRSLYADLDIWIVDALRERPHPSHPTVAQVIAWAAELAPKRTVLMHMDQSLDYRTLCGSLPSGIEPGYDGLEIAA